jgi:hydrogenase-1 operon protein HyaE
MSTLHPLMQRLLAEHGARLVTPDDADAFCRAEGAHVLLFGGDPVRFPEALDVAVVLPELRAALAAEPALRFDIGVVPREHEDALARRYAVQRWPSLLFMRGDGTAAGWLGAVSGMQDWTDYIAAVRAALLATPGRVPGVGIPVVSSEPASACH